MARFDLWIRVHSEPFDFDFDLLWHAYGWVTYKNQSRGLVKWLVNSKDKAYLMRRKQVNDLEVMHDKKLVWTIACSQKW